MYLKPQSDVVRDRLAAALAECARREHYDHLLAFVADPTLGESRIYFLRPINSIGNRIKRGQGRAVIEDLRRNPALPTRGISHPQRAQPKRGVSGGASRVTAKSQSRVGAN
jgi:hypothetical protein